MSTEQSIHTKLHADRMFQVAGLPANRHMADRRHSSGTADQQLSLILRIKIQHIRCLQIIGCNPCRTKHADFFVDRNHNFQRRMWYICSIQNGKCKCNRDSIVAAKGCPVCTYHIPIKHQIQSLRMEINLLVVRLLTDHIHMSL